MLVSVLNVGISYASTNTFDQVLTAALGSTGVDAGEAAIFKWGSSARIQNAYVVKAGIWCELRS
jgi:hypothetical protein